ncbi:P-loop containing nucleoside triphosphate hydrolase protein [Hyaloraphidium curvatum]|nr:P-loop containing nucleoside triphosphate hydrolase protein [Hyaloraphidium curvatum]
MAKAPQTWDDFIQRFRKVLRFAWPDRWAGRASLIGCFILLVLGRIVNVNVPLTYKRVVDDLTNPTSTTLPYRSLFLFAGLKILQGGLLDAMSGLLWVPVAQHITKDVSVKLFQHLMSLSIRWHMLRKTGETIKIQSRGVTSIVDILNACLLQVAPIFLDIGLACTYFSTQFDSMFSLIVFSTMIIYIFASFKLTQLRVRHRKASNQLENKVSGKAVDALVNFESVKYFANERFEAKEYATAFDNYQAMEWQVSIMNSIANVIQVMIIQLGMLIGAIEVGRANLLTFPFSLTYVGQLYGPLGQLQRQYRTLQRAMIDLESMLELFETVPEVQDKPNAVALSCPAGQIDFDHITFAYDAGKTPVIKDFDAHVQAGHTVALVGTSGGGKSTTLRLLYRFMDVTGGAIRVDGQDIRDVTQDSLRKVIGVVPQDTALFNNTIRYNIRYGRLDATDQEVEEAAKAAQIYDRVMSFELGFDTIVGERGLRLSGGEKQRIAIARTILRRPKILFLDEATSALDTQTEKAIQEQLNQLSAGKTTLTIAHRLSTVINSDMILVLDQGRIIERGSFDELLALNGIFAGMWQAQLRDPLEDKQPKRDRSADPTPGLRSGRGVSLRRDGDSELDD